MLQDAHDQRQPIALFEVVDRRFGNLVGLPFLPLMVAALVPTLRPFDWRWALWTYVVPVLPLAILWDGLVSMLRVYQADEMTELVDGLEGFDWEIGRIRLDLPGIPLFANYLVGLPNALRDENARPATREAEPDNETDLSDARTR